MAGKGPERQYHDMEGQNQKPTEGDISKKLDDAKIKPKNTDTLKKLGFTFEKSEIIDQKTLEAKMGDKFDKMSESVGKGNIEAQAELNNIKQEFIKNLGTETDINKQLELCEQFLKEFDNERSQEIGEQVQRANQQAENMKNESDISSKERGEKNTRTKEMTDRIKELQRLEKNRKDVEKINQNNTIRQVVSAEKVSAGNMMIEFQKPTNIV